MNLERIEPQYLVMAKSTDGIYKHYINKAEAIEELKRDVCFCLGISREDLRKPTRLSPYINARRVMAYVLQEEFHLSDEEAGKETGLHRTTALYHREFIKDKIELGIIKQYPEEYQVLKFIQNNLK